MPPDAGQTLVVTQPRSRGTSLTPTARECTRRAHQETETRATQNWGKIPRNTSTLVEKVVAVATQSQAEPSGRVRRAWQVYGGSGARPAGPLPPSS